MSTRTHGLAFSHIGRELEEKRQTKKDLEFMLWFFLVMFVFVAGIFAYTSANEPQVEFYSSNITIH